MAPVPEEHRKEEVGGFKDTPIDENTIVISGMSGLMSGCNDLKEFSDKLYDKVNMVNCDVPRWKYEHPELPQYYGKVPQLERFDAQFFMVHYRLAHSTDAMSRKLLEQAYQAIYDSGICPTELSGKRVGVFIATGICETEKACSFSEVSLGILGCNRAMYANRISYWLNVKGPSLVVDAACCSSMVALEKAHHALLHGQCDAAIVGAAKLLLHPQATIHYQRLVPLNSDGKTKCYDINADGQSMSEAINVVFLQKHKDAKRIYASLCYAKTEFAESKEICPQKYGSMRDPETLSNFFRGFYKEAKVSPSAVEYVEGFGAAVPEADKTELQTIEKVFCKDRSDTLLVGSLSSNIGYTEAASGTSAIIKLLLAYQTGIIPSNLHCDSPRQDIPALREGRMRIVNEHQRFRRTYSSINSFSVTGVNGHALLQGIYKPKDFSRYQSKIPYLLTISGRQESAVEKVLTSLKSHKMDPEEIALFHNIHRMRISKHLARGYGIYTTNEAEETVTLSEKVDYYDDARRPLWFVYSGMGSQWAGMGTDLLKIPIFAAAIERCHKVLEPKGVDIMHIITTTDPTVYDNILNSFVGIAAIQIGLTDVLRSIGLVPDKIIGHSVGELGCAYADGCFTAEEMIHLSYNRGLVSIQTPFIRGSMAAVGLGYKQIQKICPTEIEVACHNGPASCTISGPAQAMKEFVEKLTNKGVFAKEVQCSNIAYHSRYIAEAGPELLRMSGKVITTPKLRSNKWLSTSVPQERWTEPAALYSSAEYHTNNLLNPVLFEETSRLVPYNAVLIEVAPHGLLQAILKRSLSSECRHIPLTRRGHSDNSTFLLEAIGKIYMEGYDTDLSVLYPKVEFPVSTETRSLSHLVEWAHGEQWNVCLYVNAFRTQSSVYKPIFTVHDEENKYLAGHVIEGTRVFPFAGALVSVWDTLAMTNGLPRHEVSVQFQDVQFHTQPPLYDQHPLHITVALQRGSGRFEVTYHEDTVIVDGYIFHDVTDISTDDNNDENNIMNLTSSDIYRQLYERGYEYKDNFRSIIRANSLLTHAQIKYQDNWVLLLDGVLQLNALRCDHDGISYPHYIKRICLNMTKHWKDGKSYEDGLINARVHEFKNSTRCGGLTMEHIIFKNKPPLDRQYTALKTTKFFPYFHDENTDIFTTLYVFLQIVAENLNKKSLTVFNISNSPKYFLIDKIMDLLKSPPKIDINVVHMKKDEIFGSYYQFEKPDLVLMYDILSDKHAFEALYGVIPPDTFVISLGVETKDLFPTALYRCISAIGKDKTRLELALWRPSPPASTTAALSVRVPSDFELLKSGLVNLPPRQRLLVLTPHPPIVGLKEVITKLQKDKDENQMVVAMINYKNSSEQDLEHLPNFDLTFNILNKGKWGGEYYQPLRECSSTGSSFALSSTHPGDLDSLRWVERSYSAAYGIPVKVYYAGLNVHDAKRATAELSVANSNDDGFGMDFSGVTERGDRVMGLVPNGSACGKVFAKPELMWPVPIHWSLEDAATVPFAYCLAFYCLSIKCKLFRGMNVLVHGGAGALGQAVISIALANGCKVFTTVSDVQKKKFVRHLFPDLPANHIGNSRDDTFRDMILIETNGIGCQIVISCVKGELKNATLTCCAMSGTTVDIVQLPTKDNFMYGMSYMTKSRSYVPIDFMTIFNNKHEDEIKVLQLLVSEGIARGYVRPLSRVTYAPMEAPRAFRLLMASRHRGRVLLRLADATTSAQSRISCNSNHSHLILCDEDGFGLLLADKLVKNGAKKLYLHYPHTTSYLELKRRLWQKHGAEVHISATVLNSKDCVTSLIKDCAHLGPVEGIFAVAVKPKNTASNDLMSVLTDLDLTSRKLCSSLRYFTVITDDAITGKQICLERAQHGYPALHLHLYNLMQYDEKYSKECLKWPAAISSLESALQSKETSLLVYNYSRPLLRQSLLDEVAKIPGVSITRTTADRTKLEQVGIDSGRAQEVCNILQEKFNIILSKENVPEMTIAKLKSYQAEHTDLQTDVPGFGAYFDYVDPDELLANSDLVLMQTLVHSYELRSDEYDMNQTYLCIVPGLEGHHKRFQVMCERLKLPAVVLQPGLIDAVNETVPDMAQRMVQITMKKLKKKNQFYLLGYEFGIFVALEMAAILESYGMTGTVFCLGGTPEEIQGTLQDKLHDSEDMQNSLAMHLYKLFSGSDISGIYEDLSTAKTWDQKVDVFANKLLGKVAHSSQYIRALIQTAYARIELACNYKLLLSPLKSKVVVMRATQPKIDAYLKNLSYEEPVVHQLHANLAHAPKDLRCAAIINKHLDEETLKAYTDRNHCEAYLINDGLFMRFSTE